MFPVIKALLIMGGLYCRLSEAQPTPERPEAFVVAVIYPEGPPFYSLDPLTHAPIGIFADFLQKLGNSMNLQITFLPTARKKIEDDIIAGRADGAFLAPQWVGRQDQMAFTDPVLSHKQYFFSLTSFGRKQTVKSIKDALRGKETCIRQDYLYPELDEWFKQKIILRTDVSSQDLLINMLVEDHCELIYLDDIRAQWALNTQDFSRKVFRSPISFAQDNVPLALAKKWTPRLREFNKHINKLHQSGVIRQIIEQNTVRKPIVVNTAP